MLDRLRTLVVHLLAKGPHSGSTAETAQATLPDGSATLPGSTTPLPLLEAYANAEWTCAHCTCYSDGSYCCDCGVQGPDPYEETR